MAVYPKDIGDVVTDLQAQINRLSAAASSKPAIWTPNITQSFDPVSAPAGFMDWSVLPGTDPCPITVVNSTFMLEFWTKVLVQNARVDISYRVYPSNDPSNSVIPLQTTGSTRDGFITVLDTTTVNSQTILPVNIRQIVALTAGSYFVEFWWRKSVYNSSYAETNSLYGRTIITRTL